MGNVCKWCSRSERADIEPPQQSGRFTSVLYQSRRETKSQQERETESPQQGKETDFQLGREATASQRSSIQTSSQSRELVLVLPKIVIVDESNREHEIYDPETPIVSEEERDKVEKLAVKLGKSPVKRHPSRKRLMLVKQPSIEEEPGPSGMQIRRRSSSSREGSLYHERHRLTVPSSSIVSQDPFDAVLSAARVRMRPKLDLTFERGQENTERMRELMGRFGYKESPGTPTQGLLSPTTPVEQYQFDKFKAKCERAKKRRKSWW